MGVATLMVAFMIYWVKGCSLKILCLNVCGILIFLVYWISIILYPKGQKEGEWCS